MLPLMCFHWPGVRSLFVMVSSSFLHERIRAESSKPQATPSSRWRDHQSDGVGFRIEEDARLAMLELRAHVRDLLLEGKLARTVVGAFAQHERFDHPPQRLGGELRRGDEDGLGQLRRVSARRRSISM